MTYEYGQYPGGLESGAALGEVVTPSDSVDLTNVSRAIWVGGAGDVTVRLVGDPTTAITFTAVPVGWLEVRATRVDSTGTDATTMVAVS